MPKPNGNMDRNEMFLRKKLDAFVQDLTNRLESVARDDKTHGVPGYAMVKNFLDSLCRLKEMDYMAFGDDGRAEPQEDLLAEYIEKCRDCLNELREIKNIFTNGVVTDHRLHEISHYISDVYADEIVSELKPYLKMKKPARDWGLTEEEEILTAVLIADSRQEMEAKTRERIRDYGMAIYAIPSMTESGGREELPTEILLTGDAHDLAAYYIKNQHQLSGNAQRYLRGRMGALAYFDELEEKSKTSDGKPVFTVTQSEDGRDVSLNGYRGKYQYQTTGNGCWSASYAMLLEGRGVSLNQEMVRAFRPAVGVNDLQDISKEQVAGVVADSKFSALEMADLTLKVLPNTALRQTGIPYYGHEDREDVKEYLRQNILYALSQQKSPIILNNGAHCTTIVGIEGDMLKILNSSSGEPGLEERRSLEDIVKGNNQLSLTWLQTLTFDKDGKCTDMPQDFAGLRYDGGKLLDAGDNSDVLNRAGNTFTTVREQGRLGIHDVLYLPDEVPAHVFGKEILTKGTAKVADAKKPEMKDIDAKRFDEEAAEQLLSEKERGKMAEKAAKVSASMQERIDKVHSKIYKVIDKWDPYGKSYDELRNAVAKLLAYKILQEKCAKKPENARKYESAMKDETAIRKFSESQEFLGFYTTMRNDELLKLCEYKQGEKDVVVDRFYEKFRSHVQEAKKECCTEEKEAQKKEPVYTARELF